MGQYDNLTLGEMHKGYKSNSALKCQHCGTTGKVIHRKADHKSGISGGKATGAILTGGLSLLATGLSKKVKVNEFKCKGCGITWIG